MRDPTEPTVRSVVPQDECVVYLVRHGATDNNRAKPPRLQGRRTDPGLSEEGRAQAAALARFLAMHPVDHVFSSPLLRARQTAQAVADQQGLDVQTIDALTEVDVGDWEGLAWPEIMRRWPEAYDAYMDDPIANPYFGGEHGAHVADRVRPAMGELMRSHLGSTILVLAHNVVNRIYLMEQLGGDPRRFRSIPQDNAGLNVLRYRGDREDVKIVTINAVFHLQDLAS